MTKDGKHENGPGDRFSKTERNDTEKNDKRDLEVGRSFVEIISYLYDTRSSKDMSEEQRIIRMFARIVAYTCLTFILLLMCSKGIQKIRGNERIIVEAEEIESQTRVYDCFVQGNCTEEQYEDLLEKWEELPEEWRDQFEADGWIVLITNDNFWGAEGYNNLLGLTNPLLRTIYIHAESKHLDDTVGHEFGHYIDYAAGYPSRTEEFRELWIKEGSNLDVYNRDDGYVRTTVSEYFAAICYQIAAAPETETSAPESFAYVKRYIEEWIAEGNVESIEEVETIEETKEFTRNSGPFQAR